MIYKDTSTNFYMSSFRNSRKIPPGIHVGIFKLRAFALGPTPAETPQI